MIFGRQIKFIEEIEKHLFVELQATVNEFDHVLKDYIVEKQLFEKGIDGDGQKLPGYARATIRIKIRKGQPYDRTTLRDTERFHASIEVTGTPYYIAITTEVEHAKWLVRRYGIGILHITDENFYQFFFKYFIPKYKQYVINEFAK